MTLLALGLIVLTPVDVSLSEAVEKHAETLGRVRSYHLAIESYTVEDEKPGAELKQDYELEVWSSGVSHRFRNRVFSLSAPDGARQVGPNGSVSDSSVDGEYLRNLQGWDYKHPFTLPLEMGRNAKEFSTVSASIQPCDPTRLHVRTRNERAAMLWDLRPEWPLTRIAEECELVLVPQTDSNITRIKIESTESPEFNQQWFVRVGTILDLDHQHGFLVSRIESPFQDSSIVSEVVEYREADAGFWYPVETRSRLGGDEVVSLLKVLECEINEPIPAKDLQTQFPEGAKVTEFPNRRFHIWGTDGPLKSFETAENGMQYLYARAREYQRPQGRMENGAFNGRSYIWFANFVILAVVAVLFILRKRAA